MMDAKVFGLFAKKKATAQAIAGLQSQVVGLINGAGVFEGYVDKYSDLPDPSQHNSKIWVVKTATGIPLVNRKDSGLYLSDGTQWAFLDSSNTELAKYTVNGNSLVTSNLLIEGSGVAVSLDQSASKIIFALPNTNLPNGALILDSTGKVPDTYLYGYSMKPQGNIGSPEDRLTLGDGNMPVGTLLKVVNSVEGENGTSYLLMSSPSSNPDNWIVFTGTNFPVTMVYGRSGEIVAEKGDYTDSLITLASQVDVHIAGTELSTVLADLFTKMDGKATNTLSNVSSGDLINAIKGAGFGITDVAGLAIALSEKEPLLQASTTSKYYRGDKSWQTLDKAAVGLGNVDNTADVNKPVSTPQATAIALKEDAANKTTGTLETNKTSDVKFPTIKAVYDWATGLLSEKQDTLVSGISIKTINGKTVLGSGDLVIADGGGGTTTNSLTAGTGLSGNAFNGSAAVSWSLAANYGDTINPYASKSANYVLCSPNGTTGVPTFRALTVNDLPTVSLLKGGTGLTAVPAAGQLLIGNGSGYTLSNLSAGNGITISNANGAITIENSAPAGSSGPGFRAVLSADSTLSSSGTKIPFNTETWDLGNCYNNTGSTVTLNGKSVPAYSFLPTTAGYYQVNAEVMLSKLTTGVFMNIEKNAATYAQIGRGDETGVGNIQINDVVYLNGTSDYISIKAAATASASAMGTWTRVSVQWLRGA